jgi:hypothetical protein
MKRNFHKVIVPTIPIEKSQQHLKTPNQLTYRRVQLYFFT